MKLEIEDLCVTYSRSGRRTEAVKGVSLTVESGTTLGIVGESGSGKSSMGLAIMRLLPPGAVTSGRILLDGEDLLACSEKRIRSVRGPLVGMVFQDSLAALNPVFPIRWQLVETIRRHDRSLSRRAARDRAADALQELAVPRERLGSYPHQFSGGMRQRAMIATALAANPVFLIADEATSELDTSSQRQVLDVLAAVQRARELGLIVVSHDLGVIHHACANVAVMYRGDMVEFGHTQDVLMNPKHWYTKALVQISTKKRNASGHLVTIRDSPEWERQHG